ncbi:ABC transporter ATP-binding protein [Enteractinococcus helveticum]|uniref:ABC transporter ATP-binding protein n=1 Tax=Enteractinococcus helveticum TaxID=1837282 RepID=A0A1B7LUK7_9MICC|nr:ABC transporter ATP-binding protein [Enteractinococcus helveticum]OAV51032.1 ABC transporter ATP-binding protein [Enteractinococcus helveticum]
MSLLEVTDLHVRYGAIPALKGIDLRVEEGELVAVVGANGAGKTTTLSAIAGAHRASRGTITLDGKEIQRRRSAEIARRGISLVPEDRGIFPSLTVDENLRLGSYLLRDSKEVTHLRGEIFQRFPILQQRADQGAGTLSGGEQQQLAIARALLTKPRLLMLDEPSLGLSPTLVDRVFEVIQELHDEGVTILLVEQNATRALDLANRVYVLTTGVMTASGTAQEIRASVDIESAYLGGAKPGSLEEKP